jgi:hypothetical protein
MCRTRQTELDRQNWTGRTRQQNRTSITEQAELSEQDTQNRTGRKERQNLPDRENGEGRTGLAE